VLDLIPAKAAISDAHNFCGILHGRATAHPTPNAWEEVDSRARCCIHSFRHYRCSLDWGRPETGLSGKVVGTNDLNENHLFADFSTEHSR